VKSVSPHDLIRRRVSTAENPVSAYALIGTGVAATLLLLSGGIILALNLAARISGDESGVGGLVGFVLVPFVGFAGVPWSVLIARSGGSNLFLLGVIVGPLINGALIGAVRGYIATLNKNREGS
jgi:hypothetical protein